MYLINFFFKFSTETTKKEISQSEPFPERRQNDPKVHR